MKLYQDLSAYIAGQSELLRQLEQANIPSSVIITRVLSPNSTVSKDSHPTQYSLTHSVEYLEIDSQGIIGERHHRAVRPSSGRERAILPKGTIIREHRHIFAVSLGDCKELSDRLDVEVTPELLGANLVIEREDQSPYSLSFLPQGTYLRVASSQVVESSAISKDNLIAVLQKYATQEGCGITGASIQDHHKADKSLVKRFTEESKLNRGIVCSVEFPGEGTAKIEPGQRIFFGFPTGYAP